MELFQQFLDFLQMEYRQERHKDYGIIYYEKNSEMENATQMH